MKENEAPEKIYLFENPVTETPDDRWLSKRSGDTDVEYTRTDAFIEKAFEFFGEHLWEYTDVKNANCVTYISIDGDKLKEDFKNYMEGE